MAGPSLGKAQLKCASGANIILVPARPRKRPDRAGGAARAGLSVGFFSGHPVDAHSERSRKPESSRVRVARSQ